MFLTSDLFLHFECWTQVTRTLTTLAVVVPFQCDKYFLKFKELLGNSNYNYA